MPRKKKTENAQEEQKESPKEESMNEQELEKAAEKESLDTQESDKAKKSEEGKSLEERKKELLEKAKKISEKIEGTKTEELREKVKVKKKEMLIPLEEYVKSGIYLGTKVVTPDMRPFVYRRRADGLAIFNTDLIDEKLREGIEFISQFQPKDMIIVCKRPAGWRAVKKFAEITGIRAFTKKYPAGILTNTNLENFFEVELAIVCDSWLDKNVIADMRKVGKKILMVSDTNNFSRNVTKVIIGNNKSQRSLGLILYLLTRGYCKAKGIETNIPDLDWWVSEEDEPVEVKIPKKQEVKEIKVVA